MRHISRILLAILAISSAIEVNLKNAADCTYYGATLHISGMHITSIKPEAFRRFPDTKSLYIDKTGLTEFPSGLQYLTKLTELVFVDNPHCRKLDNLRKLPLHIKENVTLLGLAKIGMKEVPTWIYHFKNLRYLSLEQNELAVLPEQLCALRELSALYLKRNRIKSLPTGFGNLFNLQKVDLGGNELTELPLSAIKLQNLRILELAGNKFTSIPLELHTLTGLRMLDISGNRIEELLPSQDTISKFKDSAKRQACILSFDFILTKLIRRVKIYFKPRILLPLSEAECKVAAEDMLELYGFGSLEVLNISTNFIKEIPKNILQLHKLKELDIQENLIEEIPSDVFNMNSLQILKLDYNGIRSIPSLGKRETATLLNVSLNDNFIDPRSTDSSQLEPYNNAKVFFEVASRSERCWSYEDALKKYNESQKVHWNVEKIKKVRLDEDITKTVEHISDKMMLKMWIKIIRYFCCNGYCQVENETNPALYSEAEFSECDELIQKIVDLKIKVEAEKELQTDKKKEFT